MNSKVIIVTLLLIAALGSAGAGNILFENTTQQTKADVTILMAARPAAKADSPEQAALDRLTPSAKPADIRPPAREQIIGECRKDPECARQLATDRQGGKGSRPRPAAKGDSPEDIEFRRLNVPPQPVLRPRSDMAPTLLGKLLARLNPIGTAYAVGEKYSVHLTPSRNMMPGGRLYGIGVVDSDNSRRQDAYLLHQFGSTTRSYAESRPYVMLTVTVPYTGRYLVSFRASRGTAKLRHQPSGPVINEWDKRSESCDPCDYVALVELEAGDHYFYYWTNDAYQFVYSATVSY